MRIPAFITVLLLSSAAFADATVEQKTQVHFGGPLGGVINVFGGKSTREGVTNTTIVKGNRKLTRSEDHGELVDLDAEKVYNIDFARKTYTVTTFDELRRKFEEAQERARKHTESSSKKEEQKGPEWEVEFAIKSTGKNETINGWSTHEEVATVTVHEKGKKLEESGGFVLTSDMWMGPRVPAMRELADFERKFVTKVYGNTFDAEMVKMAAAMAMQPAFGKAMKTFGEHRGKFDGTPIRTTMTFETVAGPATQQQAKNDDDSAPTSVGGAVFGGLMKRAKERQAERQAQSGNGPARSPFFDSTSELLRATASAENVGIPAGFTQK
jgi:hypothetical protein